MKFSLRMIKKTNQYEFDCNNNRIFNPTTFEEDKEFAKIVKITKKKDLEIA